MDLSLNKINKLNNVNFKGAQPTVEKDNSFAFEFFPPPYNTKKETPYLVFTPALKDENGEYVLPPKEQYKTIAFDENNRIGIKEEFFKRNDISAFAYGFKMVDKETGAERYAIDPYKQINAFEDPKTGEKVDLNLIEVCKSITSLPKLGAMRHTFLDSDCALDKNGKIAKSNPDFAKNHYTSYGGNMKGLLSMVQAGFYEPYTYVMSSPDIGNDTISDHGYWPQNQYQCKDMQTFKDVNFELFKQGKGYVADGAFTSMGIQSPMVQHVLKWGESSPFYNMLKVDGRLNPGVLPNNDPTSKINNMDYVGVKVINNPNSKSYDKNKPTEIQFFDDRLTSDKLKNSDELIERYDTQPTDHYEITKDADSVHQYHFEISPKDERLKEFKNSNFILLKDLDNPDEFLTFDNFTIKEKRQAAGANFWDGNVDIIKMNLSNPTKDDPKNIEGFYAARDYIYGAIEFFTETIQSDILLRTALLSKKEKEKVANENRISSQDYQNFIKRESRLTSIITKKPKTTKEYASNFPLQSIEFSPELSVIFAEPNIKSTINKNGTTQRAQAILDSVIEGAMPDTYKNNEEYKAYVTKAYSNTILKNIFAGAINPDAVNDDGSLDINKLKNTTLKSIETYEPTTPEQETRQVINKLKNGISKESVVALQDKIKKDLQEISLTDFKLAESIMLQGHGGLNWRFDASKDVGDLDTVRNGEETFDNIWNGDGRYPGVQEFWETIAEKIKKYNPTTLLICEITSLGEFYSWCDPKSLVNFDKNLGTAFIEKAKKQGVKDVTQQNIQDLNIRYEEHPPYRKEMQMLAGMGATSSNFDKYFNNFSFLAGADPEHGYERNSNAGNISHIKNQMADFLRFTQSDVALISHTFTESHDKPRLLHVLPLDTTLFHKMTMDLADEDSKAYATKLTGRTDYQNMSSKAIAVAQAMDKTLKEMYKNDPKKLEALEDSLVSLVNGEDSDGDYSFKRADAFGATSYDISINDLYKRAGINDREEMLDFKNEMLKDYMDLQERIWQIMGAVCGTATLFNGQEYGMTGYETSNKNQYVADRFQTQHELKDDKRFSSNFKKTMADTRLGLSQEMRPLYDGTPISLEIQNQNDMEFWPILKYNSKGAKTLSIVSNIGLPNGEMSYKKNFNPKATSLKSIKLEDEDKRSPLEEGTVLKRKIYDKTKGTYIDENKKYVIKNGELKTIDGSSIVLTDTVSNFYVA